MAAQTYVPGVCNIGPAEIARRRQSGWSAAIVAVILITILLGTHAAPAWRLLLFFPVAGAAIGFLQAAFHFCVGFGFGGLYNVLKPAGETETVEKAEFRAIDRKKAQTILAYGVVIGILVALAAYWA